MHYKQNLSFKEVISKIIGSNLHLYDLNFQFSVVPGL